jgi:hypothetical protein
MLKSGTCPGPDFQLIGIQQAGGLNRSPDPVTTRTDRKHVGKLAWEKLTREEFGGARRDRTVDLLHAMQALSQLSYSPTCGRGATLRGAPEAVKNLCAVVCLRSVS